MLRQSERGESLAPNESNIFHILQNSGFRHFCYLIPPSLVWTFRPAFCPHVPSLLFAWTFRALSLSLRSFPAFCLDLSVASPSFPAPIYRRPPGFIYFKIPKKRPQNSETLECEKPGLPWPPRRRQGKNVGFLGAKSE